MRKETALKRSNCMFIACSIAGYLVVTYNLLRFSIRNMSKEPNILAIRTNLQKSRKLCSAFNNKAKIQSPSVPCTAVQQF